MDAQPATPATDSAETFGTVSLLVPVTVVCGVFMTSLDQNVIVTALPGIGETLGRPASQLGLLITAYVASLIITMPIGGWAAERFGLRNSYCFAVLVFGVASALCGMASDLWSLVAARALQGFGGALVGTLGQVTVLQSFPRNRTLKINLYISLAGQTGPLVGPPVGGFITTYFSWHWIFLINVPIGVVGIWLATRFLPMTPSAVTPRLDVPGFILSGIAASGVVFGLSVMGLAALPPYVGIVTTVVGLLSGVAYLFHARHAVNPLLALNLFDNQTFRACVLGGGLFRIGIGAVPFLLPLMLQIGFGLTPFQSGMITFVSAIGALGMKLVTTWVFRVGGFRNVLVLGSLISAISVGINGLFTPETPYALILAVLLVGGFLRSMFFTGINALTYAEISPEDTSKATPIAAVAQQLSIALGVAVAGGILETSTHFHGGTLTLTDFHIAFFIVAGISALAAIWFVRLAPDAGSAVSGHSNGSRAAAETAASSH